jgi:predicted peptidase
MALPGILGLAALVVSSCNGLVIGTGINNEKTETFDPADRPAYVQDTAGDYYFCEPWNYNQARNARRKYPLFVYLHGSGSSGVPGILPCFHDDPSYDTQRIAYPTFVYLPHASGGFDFAKIIAQIEAIRAAYRIDSDRIYLMGYSMGGSGSYALANSYYDYNGTIFAGSVRMAGQSQTTVRDAIADKASIWYHVGLSDIAERVTTARESYAFLKGYHGNSRAVETKKAVPIEGYPGTTWTLTKGSVEIAKYTEYDSPVGHGISNFPLNDPYLLEWLFAQSLKNR